MLTHPRMTISPLIVRGELINESILLLLEFGLLAIQLGTLVEESLPLLLNLLRCLGIWWTVLLHGPDHSIQNLQID